MAATTAFPTIQYCIDHRIPCFTFAMDHTKKCYRQWKTIRAEDAPHVLSPYENGFAIRTGVTHLMVDLDMKHTPPAAVHDVLMDHCAAIEKTPGGYHFWYVLDERTAEMVSCTNAAWHGVTVNGLDIRAKNGIAYCHPSAYVTCDGARAEYQWLFGDLGSAEPMPDTVWDALQKRETTVTAVVAVAAETKEEDPLLILLRHLSPRRADDYAQWIQVGMILRQEGYPCELWEEWSKQSVKYRAGECSRKWAGFATGDRDRRLSRATLFYWLKTDCPEVFQQLRDGEQVEMEKRFRLGTHADLADVFVMRGPHRLLYSSETGWYVLRPNGTWKGTGSTDVTSIPGILTMIRGECVAVAEDILRRYQRDGVGADDRRYQDVMRVTRQLGMAGFVKGVASFLSGHYYVEGVDLKWNAARHLFAFDNGVMDVRDGSFRLLEPEDYVTVTCGYDYAPASESTKDMVRGFLAKIWPNEAVLEYNLCALSRCLSGENTDQVFHVFTGTGANGKSCLMDLCKLVFGDYYQTFSVSYLTKESDGKDRPLPELAAAQYSRMLVTSEPDDRDRFQVSLLKNLTGNEEVTFRGMYARAVTRYVPQFKLWVLTNDVPRLSKWDQAIERRMRCVHFPTRFCYEPKAENESLRDDTLSQRFREEAGWRDGLLGLLLDAYLGNRGTLVMPPAVAEFTEEYLLANNPVGSWLRTHYDRTGRREDRVQRTELYRQFLQDTGMQKSQTAFGEEIAKCKVDILKIHGLGYFYGLIRKVVNPDNAVIIEDEKTE